MDLCLDRIVQAQQTMLVWAYFVWRYERSVRARGNGCV